jgi:hypothetical protein
VEAAELEANGDLVYFCEVRWLSRGNMLNRVFQLRECISEFLESKNKLYPQFKDPEWISRLAFLADITTHINNLNMQLQGKDNLAPELMGKISAFELKLQLWERQLSNGNYSHFQRLTESECTDPTPFVEVISQLRTEFKNRFGDFRAYKEEFRLFVAPFDIDVSEVPTWFQMEAIELQCSEELKAKFSSCSLFNFYKNVIVPSGQFPSLIDNALQVVSMFGSTYRCEQLFSKMKFSKSQLRSQLTDNHLNDILFLSSSVLKPDLDSLCSDRRHIVSNVPIKSKE